MRTALAVTVLTMIVLVPAPSAEGVSADRPRVALSVSPAQLTLAAPGSRRFTVRNDGAERVVVDVGRRALPRQTARNGFLRITPTRLSLRTGRSAVLTLRVRGRGAEPGDHHLLVLLTTRPPRGGRVAVRVRLGLRLSVRVAGRIVRRLSLGGLRLEHGRGARLMFVSVANRGNVTVQVAGHVTALLVRRGRQVARLGAHARRALAPGARSLLALRYAGRVRGPVIAVVRVRLGRGVRVEHRYRIRL